MTHAPPGPGLSATTLCVLGGTQDADAHCTAAGRKWPNSSSSLLNLHSLLTKLTQLTYSHVLRTVLYGGGMVVQYSRVGYSGTVWYTWNGNLYFHLFRHHDLQEQLPYLATAAAQSPSVL